MLSGAATGGEGYTMDPRCYTDRMITITLLLALSSLAPRQDVCPTVNSGFEEGVGQGLPVGWSDQVSGEKDYAAGRARYRAFEGQYSGYLKSIKGRPSDSWGSVYQFVPAEPWSGREVILSAAMRTDIPDAEHTVVRLYLTAYDGEGAVLQGFTYRVYSIREPEWGVYELAAGLPKETAKLGIQFNQLGQGVTWVDSVSIRLAPTRSDGIPYSSGLRNGQFDLGAMGSEPWLWTIPNRLRLLQLVCHLFVAAEDIIQAACSTEGKLYHRKRKQESY